MKPTNIIQDLLRTYGQKGTSVQEIAETGKLFSFNDNQIRVSLSRLVARGTVEIVERGRYRLCKSTDPINSFAEQWREGEARVKPWSGAWLCVHLPETPGEKSKRALSNFGFAPTSKTLWIRPDNLSMTKEQLKTKLDSLGLPMNSVLMANATLDTETSNKWKTVFDSSVFEKRHRKTIKQLQDSLDRLESLSTEDAKKESFEIGGKGIQILAKDPLFPESMLAPKSRKLLWQTMCTYDEVGRNIWAGSDQPFAMPISQSQFDSNELAL